MTSIPWTDLTWNFIAGCSREDVDCDNCYAINTVARGMSEQHKGLVKVRPKDAARPGVDWNGTINLAEHRLDDPLKLKSDKRIFTNSISDPFHQGVAKYILDRAFAVMFMTSLREHGGHPIYQMLTKRPKGAYEYLTDPKTPARIIGSVHDLELRERVASHIERHGIVHERIHLGVSCGDERIAQKRIGELGKCPAAVRWVSYEPAFGRASFRPWLSWMNWIVIGGESTVRGRPFDIVWARHVLAECEGEGVSPFMKQLGDKPFSSDNTISHFAAAPRDGKIIKSDSKGKTHRWFFDRDRRYAIYDPKGEDPSEWPEDIRVRKFPALPKETQP